MKKVLAILVFVTVFGFCANAQYYGRVRYSDIKDYYNPREYVSDFYDPYSPGWAGVASFLIPGLGQCICDEWGRGLGILGANVGFAFLEILESSLTFYGAAVGTSYYMHYGDGWNMGSTLMAAGGCSFLATLAGQFIFNVWNICDAVDIAKVKNMYYRDGYPDNASLDLRLEPNLAMAPVIGGGFKPAPGLSLKVSF